MTLKVLGFETHTLERSALYIVNNGEHMDEVPSTWAARSPRAAGAGGCAGGRGCKIAG